MELDVAKAVTELKAREADCWKFEVWLSWRKRSGWTAHTFRGTTPPDQDGEGDD